MYTQFYGLREKPFALSPDPRYLFLADSHREALAHLLYGIEQGEGFIAITGEVGTGKTTLCRTLLQRIEPGTEIAFIFNPQLSALELLQAISGELGLESVGRGRRELTDQLNQFLLRKKAEGRRVLLIIDEAQNLSPEALEQIRLLSNLETDTSKLIQIVLIGQPELDTMLESQSLRQLRQRISVRWRLLPLTALETRDYVRHRLRIAAGAPRDLFTELALREIHRRSDGIPRVVNLICDRALLAGYAAGAQVIGLGLVVQTDREIRGGAAPRTASAAEGGGALALALRRAVPAAGLLGVGVAAVLGWQILGGGEPGRDGAAVPAPAIVPVASAPDSLGATLGPPAAAADASAPAPMSGVPAPGLAAGEPFASAEPPGAALELPAPAPLQPEVPAAPLPAVAAAPPAGPVEPAAPRVAEAAPPAAASAAPLDLASALAGTDPLASTARSLDALLQAWGARPVGAASLSITQALAVLSAEGLEVLPLPGADLERLRSMNLPALVRLVAADGTLHTALLTSLDAEGGELRGLDPGPPLRVAADALMTAWSGEAFVAWRDFEALPEVLRPGSVGPSVEWLQRALGMLGYFEAPPTGAFDAVTAEAVRSFQASRHLNADGTVGPLTKMALYGSLADYAVPRLSASAGSGETTG
jgi:general secretion pathway protein A